MSHVVEDGVSDTGAVNTPPPETRPFTSWRGAIDWWYRPLIVAEPWLALGYLAVGALWALAMFVVTVVTVSLVFGLLFAVVGFLLIVPTFALVNAMTVVERRRAAWVGPAIQPRRRRTSPEVSWFRSIAMTLTDPERWRQVGFILAYVVAAPLLFSLALTPWIVLLGLFFGNAFDLTSVDLLGVVAGLALAGAAPRITVAVAGVNRSFVAWFLGPDTTAELQDRVDELAEQRTVILDAVGAERRRIERNLHDGVQQQLVALGIDIGRARSRLDDDPAAARELLDDALIKVRGAVGELRVIGRGLHPAVLDDRGLDAALSSIVASASIPISVDVSLASRASRRRCRHCVLHRERIGRQHPQARECPDRLGQRRRVARCPGVTSDPHLRARRRSGRRRRHARDRPRRHPGTGRGRRRNAADRLATWRADHTGGGAPDPTPAPATPTTLGGDMSGGPAPLRAVVADDSVLLRDGLVRLLQDAGIEVVAAVGDADALVAAVDATLPDIALVDVRMPPTHTDEGIRAAVEIRRGHPTVAVLVLSQYVEERYASDLLTGETAGIGYLLKDRVVDVDDFILAVRRVAAGGSAIDAEVVRQLIGRTSRELDRLTPRELEVLGLMAEGLSNSGIAERLVVSLGAVEKHISNVFTKLGLEHETAAHRRVLAVLTYLGQRD